MQDLVLPSEQRLAERVRYLWVRLLAVAALALAGGGLLSLAVNHSPPSSTAGATLRDAVGVGVAAARAPGARILLRRGDSREGLVCSRSAPVAVSEQQGRWRASGDAMPGWARSLTRRC